MRWNWLDIKLTILKYSYKWHWVYSQCCGTTSVKFQNIFITPRETPFPIKCWLPSSCLYWGVCTITSTQPTGAAGWVLVNPWACSPHPIHVGTLLSPRSFLGLPCSPWLLPCLAPGRLSPVTLLLLFSRFSHKWTHPVIRYFFISAYFIQHDVLFFFFQFIFGCTGSSLLCVGFL